MISSTIGPYWLFMGSAAYNRELDVILGIVMAQADCDNMYATAGGGYGPIVPSCPALEVPAGLTGSPFVEAARVSAEGLSVCLSRTSSCL